MSTDSRKGAPQASQPCRTPSIPTDLAMLEAEFLRLTASFADADPCNLADVSKRLDEVFADIVAAPITTNQDVAVKIKIALARVGWIIDEDADHPDATEAGMLREVLSYLEEEAQAAGEGKPEGTA